MSKRKKKKTRAEPTQNINTAKNYNTAITNWFLEEGCIPSGYVKLVDSPEVKAGVEKIAEIVSLMTIHLMQNTENGDIRIKDALSKKIDIYPNKYMNRQLFINWIVQEMLLNGNAIVLPKIHRYIDDLIPITNKKRQIHNLDYGYQVKIGEETYDDEEVLNFRYNPDLDKPWIGKGQDIILRDFVDNLSQAYATTNDFMTNKMMPSIIVKVQGMTEGMTTEDGREELEKRFLKRNRTGQPWIIPSELMDITQIKPITLSDIAIADTIKLNKESVASILGVPSFLLGVGAFSKNEYNNFISTKISVIAKAIEQELTRKLLINDDLYFQFNISSLYSYDLPEIADVYTGLMKSGIVSRNEVRDKIGLSTIEGLDDLIMLENYIPADKIGDQNKLKKGGNDIEN